MSGPGYGTPDSLFRAPRNRLTPTLLRCLIRIDCGFRNRLLLGLAIWFSKTEPLLVVAATSCYRPASLHPIQPGGRILYFESAFLSSERCRFTSPARLDPASSRGRGTYFASAFPVNPLRRPFSSARPAFAFRGGEAASTTAAFGVNHLRRLSLPAHSSPSPL